MVTREILDVVVSGIQNGRDNLCDFDAVGIGFEAKLDAVEIVLEVVGLVPVAVLERVERDIDDVVDILHGSARTLGTGHDLFLQYADDLQPGVVHFDEFAESGIVAKQVDLGAFAEHADGGASGVVGFVEEAAFGQMQTMDDGVCGAHADKAPEFRARVSEARARGGGNGGRRESRDPRCWL